MRLYTKASVLDCESEADLIQHNLEIENIIQTLTKYTNYDCAVIIKHFDDANKEKEPIIKQCKLHDCFDMVQFADIKNGIDIGCVEGFITFICYGAEYTYNNQVYLCTTGIQIRPYDNARNFLQNILK